MNAMNEDVFEWLKELDAVGQRYSIFDREFAEN